MSGRILEDAYRYSREAALKKLGKGVVWLMVRKGAGLISTSPKEFMIAAIMRQEAKDKLEKEKGLKWGGGCGMLHADTRFSAASPAQGTTPKHSRVASARGKGKGATPSPAASQNPSGEVLGGGGMSHGV
jgi:hypothetical protein